MSDDNVLQMRPGPRIAPKSLIRAPGAQWEELNWADLALCGLLA